MDVDVLVFKKQYPHFVSFCKLIKDNDVKFIIPMFSATSGVPVVVVTVFAIKHFGTSEFLENKIKTLTSFYGYDTLLGVDEFLKENL